MFVKISVLEQLGWVFILSAEIICELEICQAQALTGITEKCSRFPHCCPSSLHPPHIVSLPHFSDEKKFCSRLGSLIQGMYQQVSSPTRQSHGSRGEGWLGGGESVCSDTLRTFLFEMQVFLLCYHMSDRLQIRFSGSQGSPAFIPLRHVPPLEGTPVKLTSFLCWPVLDGVKGVKSQSFPRPVWAFSGGGEEASPSSPFPATRLCFPSFPSSFQWFQSQFMSILSH